MDGAWPAALGWSLAACCDLSSGAWEGQGSKKPAGWALLQVGLITATAAAVPSLHTPRNSSCTSQRWLWGLGCAFQWSLLGTGEVSACQQQIDNSSWELGVNMK